MLIFAKFIRRCLGLWLCLVLPFGVLQALFNRDFHRQNMLRAEQTLQFLRSKKFWLAFNKAWDITMEARCVRICQGAQRAQHHYRAARGAWNNLAQLYHFDSGAVSFALDSELLAFNNGLSEDFKTANERWKLVASLFENNQYSFYQHFSQAFAFDSLARSFPEGSFEANHCFNEASKVLRMIAKNEGGIFTDLQKFLANAERWEYCALAGGHYNDVRAVPQTNPRRVWQHVKGLWEFARDKAFEFRDWSEYSRCMCRAENATVEMGKLTPVRAAAAQLPVPPPSLSVTTNPPPFSLPRTPPPSMAVITTPPRSSRSLGVSDASPNSSLGESDSSVEHDLKTKSGKIRPLILSTTSATPAEEEATGSTNPILEKAVRTMPAQEEGLVRLTRMPDKKDTGTMAGRDTGMTDVEMEKNPSGKWVPVIRGQKPTIGTSDSNLSQLYSPQGLRVNLQRR